MDRIRFVSTKFRKFPYVFVTILSDDELIELMSHLTKEEFYARLKKSAVISTVNFHEYKL